MKTRKLTLASVLIAIGVLLGSMLYIPVGVSKCFFAQHTINVVAAVTLGPTYAVLVAFTISLIRNILGIGSILAFPGSMIGGFLAGVIFTYSKSIKFAIAGEIFGTGILGSLVSYYLVKIIFKNKIMGLAFIYPFLISSVVGSFFAYFLIKYIDFDRILNKNKI